MEPVSRVGIPLAWYVAGVILSLSILSWLLPYGAVSEALQGARVSLSIAVLVTYAGVFWDALVSRQRLGRHFIALGLGSWAIGHGYFAVARFAAEVLNVPSVFINNKISNVVFAIIVVGGATLLIAPRVGTADYQPTKEAMRSGAIAAVGTTIALLIMYLLVRG